MVSATLLWIAVTGWRKNLWMGGVFLDGGPALKRGWDKSEFEVSTHAVLVG